MKKATHSLVFDLAPLIGRWLLQRARRNFAMNAGAQSSDEETPKAGFVWIAGAGPGDAELLTVKALKALKSADVIVFDRLVNPDILAFARHDATRSDVGKSPRSPSIPQSRINDFLIREARAGKIVIRLKGGDPFTFARGGEELAALQAAGIGAEVIPGITAAAACAASAGLPLTDRRTNRTITLATGHAASGHAEHDWRALARKGNAFVVYMGVGAAAHIEKRLSAASIDPETPVVIVENGTLPEERIIETRADSIATAIAARGIRGPALIYVGIDWLSRGLKRPGHTEIFLPHDNIVPLSAQSGAQVKPQTRPQTAGAAS